MFSAHNFGVSLAIYIDVDPAGDCWPAQHLTQDGLKGRGEKETMRKPFVTLENWAVVESALSRSYQELEPGKLLTGNVYGHEKLPDTKFIYTSAIVRVDKNRGIVETRNTLYHLGEASDGYKLWDFHRKAAAA